jgi:apolipoprotein N-acyltransferase
MQEKVYLLMGMHMLSKDRSVDENKAVLISPSGQVSEYLKNHLVFGDNDILGDGKVLIQDSDYGKLATIICYDADYKGLSTAVDYHGNILSQMNDFTTEDKIMIADIPKQGIKTVYSQIGSTRPGGVVGRGIFISASIPLCGNPYISLVLAGSRSLSGAIFP